MRQPILDVLETCRAKDVLPSPIGACYGAFRINMRFAVLRVISSGEFHEGVKWEHVSISNSTRCPTWEEMCAVKELFWADDETVIQFHPKKSAYINKHPFCLHLWKHVDGHELPPEIYV